MPRNFFIFVFILFTVNSNAQKQLVDTFMSGTVLIKSSLSSSSGIFLSDKKYLYLVTAGHCLFNVNNNSFSLLDTSIYLIYYANDAYFDKSDTIKVNLIKAMNNQDLLFDPKNDITVLAVAKHLGQTSSGKFLLGYVGSSTKISKLPPVPISTPLCIDFNNIDVGDDCLMFGFPSSLKSVYSDDFDFNLPLLRKGVISGKDKKRGTIIVDCPSYQGNSGGPVISSPSSSKSKIGLIGIVSRSILHVDLLESKYYGSVNRSVYNSGYTVIIPIDFALKLISKRSSY